MRRFAIGLLVLALAPLVLCSELYLSPSGTDTWNGVCSPASTCTSANPCVLRANGTQAITSIVGSSCTLVFLGGDYGTNKAQIQVQSTDGADIIVTSNGVAVTGFLNIDAVGHTLSLNQLKLSSSGSSFKSTNTTSLKVYNSSITLLEGMDPTSASISFVRDIAAFLPTEVSSSNFSTPSPNVYYIVRFDNQNLKIGDATFSGSVPAILGSSSSLECTNVAFDTPSILQGETTTVNFSAVSAPSIKTAAFLATTALTHLTISGSQFGGLGMLLYPDQLLSDPTLNTLQQVSITTSSFGRAFTLGDLSLGAGSSLSLTSCNFTEFAGSLTLLNTTSITIQGNVMNRTSSFSTRSVLSVSLGASSLAPNSISIKGNVFSQTSGFLFGTPMMSLANVSAFTSDTSVAVDSLGIGEYVTISGNWQVASNITSLGGAKDTLISDVHPRQAVLEVFSITITNVSIDLLNGNLSYIATSATNGITGPNTSLNHFIQLSSWPTVSWNDKTIGSLPLVHHAYPLFTALLSLPSEPYVVGARFNYTISSTTQPYEAQLFFNPVPCPSVCDPLHSLTECSAVDRCTCTGTFAGPYCQCNTTGLPAQATCSSAGGAVWDFASSTTLSTALNVPLHHSVVVHGDFSTPALVTLPIGTSFSASGNVSFSGRVSISCTIVSLSACDLHTDVFVEAGSFTFSPTSKITIAIDISSLGFNLECPHLPPSNSTFLSANPTTTSPGTGWTVQFLNQVAAKRDWLETMAGNLTIGVRLLNSPSSTSNPTVNAVPPTGSCATSSTTPSGIIDVSVAPCPPVTPSMPPSPVANSKSSVLWWYWGIPVIVVGAVLIIVVIILIAVRPCSKKVVSYRGSI